MDLYKLSSYHYDLPHELIAQYPCTPRDASRLMVVDRSSGQISEMPFHEIKDFLEVGDSLVFNDTKVIPARLLGKRVSGGRTEIFLLEEIENGIWEVLARPARKLEVGSKVFFSDTFSCTVIEKYTEGKCRVFFHYPNTFAESLAAHGQIPLPQYIHRDQEVLDHERYQTVYANKPGAAAAPTAGLHFTDALLADLKVKGVKQTHITLHVGLGTFRPVTVEDVRTHQMHKEKYLITQEAAAILNSRLSKKKQICVGTTCCRTLESAADENCKIIPGTGATDIFIYPGYKFKYVTHLLTNFHLPGSTLLMLVSAFAGRELIMEAYRKAVLERFRFFSYGDAMLII